MKTFYRRNDLMDFSKVKLYSPALEVITCLFNEGIKMFVLTLFVFVCINSSVKI